MALGFYFDMTRCIGCKACNVACKDKNRLEVGVNYREVRTYEVGTFPNVKTYSMSIACQHCTNPACVAQCPTGAMYVAKDGTVLHDDELCIGCQTCVAACPYGQPKFIASTNKVGKCDGCAAIRAAGGKPACVDACPMRALDFGDMDELKSKYGSDLVSELPCLPASETGPNLVTKAKEIAKGDKGTELFK